MGIENKDNNDYIKKYEKYTDLIKTMEGIDSIPSVDDLKKEVEELKEQLKQLDKEMSEINTKYDDDINKIEKDKKETLKLLNITEEDLLKSEDEELKEAKEIILENEKNIEDLKTNKQTTIDLFIESLNIENVKTRGDLVIRLENKQTELINRTIKRNSDDDERTGTDN